jgi:hypothetical protein
MRFISLNINISRTIDVMVLNILEQIYPSFNGGEFETFNKEVVAIE